MNFETFNKLLDELDGNSLETLKQKNAKYASPDDCLHNLMLERKSWVLLLHNAPGVT